MLTYFSTKIKGITRETLLVWVLFSFLFVFFIIQSPVYYPDTYSYLRADIYRFPGYILFLRGLEFVFKGYFDVVAVALQLIFGFTAVFIIYRNSKSIFNLKTWQKLILLGVLLFPFFPPLNIANNLASEGISYPLYLLLISFGFDFLLKNQAKKIWYFAAAFVILCLTRGQFILIAPIVAVIFILKERKKIFKKRNLVYLLVLLLLPLLTKTLDATYRKMAHGYFVGTPYSYVNAITLPLYVSEANDVSSILNEDQKILFKRSFNTIDSLDIIADDVPGDPMDKYKTFHYNFPKICNQNIHDKGLKYYYKKDKIGGQNAISIEEACKEILPVLVSNNFKSYSSIYFAGIIHGFKSIFVLIFILLLTLYSGWMILKKYSVVNSLLFLSSLLIISNSMLVAFASHSIMRYLFYNYFLGVLILILLIRKLTSKV